MGALNLLRILAALVLTGALTLAWALALVPLLPWRRARIVACNHLGTAVGRSVTWLSGCPLEVRGRHRADPERPALYVSNHASMLDIFLAMWLAPTGTVGVAKKEVVYYPFIGQIYLLSGHLRIDRSDRERAVASMRALADYVQRQRLSIFMWPEGTRSPDGRLLPLKKGVVHTAIHTRLPVVPMVVSGTHRALPKGGMDLHQVPLRVDFLPAIDTRGWSVERMDEHLAEIRGAMARSLPADQRPLDT